jgi:hypothetical protein
MRIVLTGLIGAILLSACNSSGPALENQTPGPVDEVSTIEPIASAGPNEFIPPPPLTSGAFTQLMFTSINEAIFENKDVGDFSIIGALDVDGLIYIYLHNGREIYYAVSSNGSDWALSPEPIFNGLVNNDFEYYPTSIQAVHQGFVIYLGAATTDYAEHNFLYSIWTLSSQDPTGSWALSESPTLYGYNAPGGYALYLAHPIVRPYLEGFRMYYAFAFSIEGIEVPEFAVAHSWDGVFWRYTTELPTQDMPDGIVPLTMEAENQWADVLTLDIWPTQVGWQMLYLLEENEAAPPQIYLAESEDGLQWSPADVEIQFPNDQSAEDIVSASTLFFQNQYFLTYCAMPQPHEFQCYIVANDSGT